jgi:phosphopentomutase
VAAHEEKVPLTELYEACGKARAMLVGDSATSRVIARPFTGPKGAFKRTANRKDFSIEPVGRTLVDALAERGIPRTGIGKVDDLFAGRNLTSTHTPTNGDAYRLIRDALVRVDSGLVFVNVIEFDQSWGHRNDVAGFHQGMLELDRALGELLALLREDDIMAFTADHGNDPTTPSTDHARENVPLLVVGPRVKPVALGERATFADLGQTAAEFFGVPKLAAGTSFLKEIAA